MWHSRELRFSINHPTAAGHFPGNPIIPGAVLLDEVLRAVAGQEQPCTIRSAKFLKPVRPGDTVVIRWEPGEHGQVKFECRLSEAEQPVLTGSLQLEAAVR